MNKYLVVIIGSIVLSILVTTILKSLGVLNSSVYVGGIVGGIIGAVSGIFFSKNTE